MIAHQEKREAEKAEAKADDEASDASSALSSHVGSESEGEEKEENEDPELVAAAAAEGRAMVWEPLPSADGPEGDTGGGGWERAGVAEQLSAAGAATAAADRLVEAGSVAAPCSEA